MREEKADSSEDELTEAKRRFLDQARDYDFWKPVRDNPFKSVGIAFVAGVGVSFFSRNAGMAALMNPLMELSAMAAKYLLQKTRP